MRFDKRNRPPALERQASLMPNPNRGDAQRQLPADDSCAGRVARCLGLCLCALLFLSGCGYHISGSAETEPGYQWHNLYRDDVKTVAVATFTNRTFYHVEGDLTKAVINQLEAFTPYKTASREHADTSLEGEIIRVRTRTLSRDPTAAVPQEQLYIIVVNFKWRDLRTGKILVDRKDYEQTASFYPTLGEDIFAGQQQSIERLAKAIVEELQGEWGRDPNDKSDNSQAEKPKSDSKPPVSRSPFAPER